MQAQGRRHLPACQGGCLRRDPPDQCGNTRDLGRNPRRQGCGHRQSNRRGSGITESGEIPTEVGVVLFLGTRGSVG
jgi:hypothetical protein